MMLNRHKKLFLSTIILIPIILINSYPAKSNELKNTGSAHPSVVSFFKFRNNDNYNRKMRAILSQHIAETKILLDTLEKESLSDNITTKTKKNIATSQLEGKSLELRTVKAEMSKFQDSNTRLALERRFDEITNSIQIINSATTQKEKQTEIQKLRDRLTRYETSRSFYDTPRRNPLAPNGLSEKALVPQLQGYPLKSKSKNDRNGSTQAPLSSNHRDDGKFSITGTLSKGLELFFDFLIPSAAAAEYARPPVDPLIVSCYANQADYDANISLDLKLTDPELEVDQSIDPVAYEKITSLAAQLDYSPLKILEYVTNEIAYEHYFGSVKGALGTLTSGGGNDVDHASLLIALLRASSIPARYVRGQIVLQDKDAHLNWWNVKDFAAMTQAVLQTSEEPVYTHSNIDGGSAIIATHAWVETCVPYGNYRGTGDTSESHKWIPADASFKRFERKDGEAANEELEFDYADFLSKRTKTLPHEEYEKQLLENIRSQDPNLTIDDVGTTWKQLPVSYPFLPDTLPYYVWAYKNWSSDITTARSAVLPESWRAIVKIKLEPNNEFSILMTDFAQHRISLSFEGANSADITSYNNFIDGEIELNCANSSSNLTVTPFFRKDGAEIFDINGDRLNLASMTTCDGSNFRKSKMKVGVWVNNYVVSATLPDKDYLEFDTISPIEHYALSAYPFNGSNRYLEERYNRLLETLSTVTKPSDNRDETIGEFLHIVLTKYMKYITEAHRKIGRLMGTTGRSGHHIGVASTRANIEYVLDLPFAIQSNNFVIDVPGGTSKAVNIAGEDINADATRLAGYTYSHYESYIWQEMAAKDAVSTVSGLQIASAEENEVRSFTSADGLDSFLHICTNPSYPTESNPCYPQVWVDNVKANSFLSDYANKLTISKEPINYRGWMGPVYAIEHINDSRYFFGFPISSFSGGYTLDTPDPIIYSGISSPESTFSSGYILPPIVVDSSTSGGGATDKNSILSVNAAVNFGSSQFNTISGDPVNMVTGNMYHEETDIHLPARGLPLLFKRTYNSRSPKQGPLGWGWTHSFNQTLEFFDTDANNKPDTIVWTNGSGSEKYIGLDESTRITGGVRNITASKVTIPDGFYFSLQRPYSSGVAGEIEVREKSGITYSFQGVNGATGDIARLTKITDRNGNTIHLNYSGNKLITITDPDNRTLSFDYYPNTDLIHTITLDWDNTVYEYFYHDDQLTGYRNPLDRNHNTNSTSYNYYSESDGENLAHRLATFSYANGYSMTFEYYVNGKVFRHTNGEGETVTFSYNDFRREATSTDELGRVQHYIFNENGLPVEITDSLGGTETYLYEDPNDPMLRTGVIDAMGYETEYGYDTNGNLISQQYPSGDAVTYSYFTAFGQPQLIKNVQGDYSIKKYDDSGNLTDTIVLKSGFGSTVNPATFNPAANASQIVSWTRMEYDQDGFGNLTSLHQVKDFTNPNSGPWTELDYTDPNNGTIGIVPTSAGYFGDTNGDGVISGDEGLGTYQSVYDSQGRLVSGYNGSLYPVAYTYDDAGLLQEGTDALGGTRTFSYDKSGLSTGQGLMVMSNGVVILADNSTAAYDKANRRIVSSDSAGAPTYYAYDDAGNLKSIESPDGYILHFEYDDLNRVVKAYDEEGNTVEKELDLIGRVKKLIDPNGNQTTYSYYGPDNNGRLKRITDAEDNWTEFTYDNAGNVTSTVNAAGRQTLSDYDELGRVVRVVSPVYSDSVLGNVRPVTTYTYNTLGHQTHVYGGYTNSAGDTSADDLQLQARYEYDDFGRLLKKYDAANNLWQIKQYDVHGNALSRGDPNGNTTTLTYSYGGTVKSKTVKDASGVIQESIQYSRNGIGQPTRIQSTNVTFDYVYDTAHRLTKVTDDRAEKYIAYDYSLGGLLNQSTDSDGNRTSYLYDPVGRLTGIRTSDQGLISYIYDSGGRLRQKAFPNDLVSTYQYFKDNRVQSIVTTKGSTELIRNDYTYNAAGDTVTAALSLQGATQNREYVYDGLGRLTQEIDTATHTTLDQIEYDPFGNRRIRTVGGTTYYHSSNNQHQLLRIRTGSATGPVVSSFSYDDNGNMTGKTENGNDTVMRYDALDRLVSVSGDGLETETYVYDHSFRRIAKSVGSTTTNYHYNGPDIQAEYTPDWGTPTVLYGYGAAMDDPLVRINTATGSASYYHGDGLGSIVAVSDMAGILTGTTRYGAWGNITASTGNTPQYGYTGREPDATGLVYYRSRYYDPQIGRFTQPDPKGFIDGLNRYVYVMNSPVNYVDPWGMNARNSTNTQNSAGIWESTTSAVLSVWNNRHDILAGAGLFPGAGNFADAVDTVLYAFEGDWTNFGIAAASMIPIAGQGVRAAQTAARHADEAVDVASSIASMRTGGRYIDVRAVNKGGQVHHMPADSVSPFSTNKGPGILMSTSDHQKTASWGRSKSAQNYRKQQKSFIDQGEIDDAIQMDIDDIKSKFDNKYDESILQMIDSLD